MKTQPGFIFKTVLAVAAFGLILKVLIPVAFFVAVFVVFKIFK